MSARTFDTANHGQPHFHVRPRAVVRVILISLIVTVACLDALGAWYVRAQSVALNQRVAGVERHLTPAPLIAEE